MIKKILIFLFLLNSFCVGQIYEINILGYPIANIKQEMHKNKINHTIKSKGIIDLFWPIKNVYSTTFDSTNYNIFSFKKEISQTDYKLKTSSEIDSLNNLIYNNKDIIKLKKNTKTIFTLLSMIQKMPYSYLDTKWFNYEHESNIGKARFIWADSSFIWNGNDSIICDRYRLDIKLLKPLKNIYDKTDYFMENIINENIIREIWVSKKKPKHIMYAKIKSKNFPLPIYVKLKES